MLLVLKLLLWAVRSLPRSRRAVILENLALRQQLAIAVRSGRRPELVTVDRAFWIALRQVWTDWSSSLALVKPATVVAWHRRAYRAYWRHRCRKPGRPRTDEKLREVIARMVKENRWGVGPEKSIIVNFKQKSGSPDAYPQISRSGDKICHLLAHR